MKFIKKNNFFPFRFFSDSNLNKNLSFSCLLNKDFIMAIFKVSQEKTTSALKRMRDNFLPLWVRNSIVFRFLQSWIFQGFACAHWAEILFRICLELVLVAGLSFVFLIWTHLDLAILYAILVGHTVMWLFNGHFWALKISDNRRMVRNTPGRIKKYISSLEQRSRQAKSITACVLSGSLSRGKFHQYSDLDVWFTKKKGFFNGLLAFILGVRERTIAFLNRIPIELYFYESDFVDKDANEKLILLKDVEDRWKNSEHETVTIEDFTLNKMPFFNSYED